jgi:uncharacterized protein (DUF427 family)
MSEQPEIRIERADGTWVVRGAGAILAETQNALRLTEGGHEPVIYFPRGDVGMAFLEPSRTRTHCPWKGEATHFSLQSKSSLVEDVAWSYEAPKEAVAEIAGHLAFYRDKVAVEEV